VETNFVKKSINIKTNVNKTWNNLSKISMLNWVTGQKSTKMLTAKKSGVGAVRLILFDDGTSVEEHIVGWSPKKYFSYIAISGLPIDAYHATISMAKTNNTVNVTWESYFSGKCSKPEFVEFTKFLSEFYISSLKNLKRNLEK